MGGPGTSGVAAADGWASTLGATIRARWDLVLFDQRGVGRSGAVELPDAAAAWSATDATATGAGGAPPTGTDADLAAAAAQFSSHCMAKSGVDPATLRFLGTRDTAADLEALRIYLGERRLTLFGEGYGSRVVQAYAAANPEHVDGVIVDGPVDVATSAADFWTKSVSPTTRPCPPRSPSAPRPWAW